jgi:hypothetical protein
MLYSEIITVLSEIHRKQKNLLCAQKVEFFNIQPLGTYSNHWIQDVNVSQLVAQGDKLYS